MGCFSAPRSGSLRDRLSGAATVFDCTPQDSPPERLIRFYKAYRACLRAKLALWHTKEPGRLEASDWFEQATTYLHLAEKFLP